MSGRMTVRRVAELAGHYVQVRDEDDELILELTPSGALWLAQHLIRQARLALRDKLHGES